MKSLLSFLILFLVNPSFASVCPQAETETEKYIEVDTYPDLVGLEAKVQNIPNLKLHDEKRSLFKDKKLKIYYQFYKAFDPTKETIILFPGGPGQTTELLNTWLTHFEPFISQYNIVAMDHRVIGCSQKTFPDDLPPTAYQMRFAAADAEVIRRKLLGDKPWIVWGGSYGSLLAMTYTLLFPESTSKLAFFGAYTSHMDIRLARRSYFGRLTTEFPELLELFRRLDTIDGNLTFQFLRFSTEHMYQIRNREKILIKKRELMQLLDQGNIDEVRKQLSIPLFQPTYMQSSILCTEVEPYPAYPGEFALYSPIATCSQLQDDFEYYDYTQSLEKIQARTFFWQGELDHLYHPYTAQVIAEKLPNDFSFLVPGAAHGILEIKECYEKMFFSFLSGATNQELESISKSSQCQKFAKPTASVSVH